MPVTVILSFVVLGIAALTVLGLIAWSAINDPEVRETVVWLLILVAVASSGARIIVWADEQERVSKTAEAPIEHQPKGGK